jgi:hypothetical protein
MGSARTGLVLEDTSRTKFSGLGLGLELVWPWPRAVVLRLGVLASVAGIYAIVNWTIAEIHLVPSTWT